MIFSASVATKIVWSALLEGMAEMIIMWRIFQKQCLCCKAANSIEIKKILKSPSLRIKAWLNKYQQISFFFCFLFVTVSSSKNFTFHYFFLIFTYNVYVFVVVVLFRYCFYEINKLKFWVFSTIVAFNIAHVRCSGLLLSTWVEWCNCNCCWCCWCCCCCCWWLWWWFWFATEVGGICECNIRCVCAFSDDVGGWWRSISCWCCWCYTNNETFWQFIAVSWAFKAAFELGGPDEDVATRPPFCIWLLFSEATAAADAAAAAKNSTLPILRSMRGPRLVCCVSLCLRKSTLRWNALWHNLQENGL